MITLDTNPPGLQLLLDEQPATAPLTNESVVGVTRTLGVTALQQFDGTWYRFVSWSDAGTARHEIATPNGDATYTAMFVVVGRPNITDLRITSESKQSRRIVLVFSEPLHPATVAASENYQIVSAGRDKRFDAPGQPSSDDRTVFTDPPDYDQSVDPVTGALTATVTIDVPNGMQKNTFYKLTVIGTSYPNVSPGPLAGLNGNLLDGEFAANLPSGDGIDGGDFVALVAVGNKLNYPDRSGDRVSLSLSGPGVLEMVRESPTIDGVRAEAATLRLTGTTRQSNLTGRVKPAGTTSIARVTGLLDVRNNIQSNPSFVLGQVAAQVVDRILDLNERAHLRIDDLLADLRRGRD
jgi:hypothetical protein